MKASIAKALFKSYSYPEYRKIVADLLLEEKSTGNEQSEELTNYSHLNETRMNRLEKTLKVSDETSQKLKSLKNDYLWLVISEGWCGDAAQLLPIFNKMAVASEGKIELKVVLRDENLELMDLFLTNKGRAIPKLILINRATGGALAHWGPRPKGASDLIQNYKKEHGIVDEKAKTDLQLWYLHDKGISTQEEIIDMMLDLDNVADQEE
ncbi:thioredoxin family protein [Flavobacterium acetivorans]|uniref:thioredoxin family protein n=1 Tax=Flavobacterium acetivorans TaxID=2893883 RepID=UPI001E300081|nr:thioredoxin family protein [Flavobacterium sp. F-29]UFH36018.1 thioredoxin family protein [Flavobacterium sp. F-29]